MNGDEEKKPWKDKDKLEARKRGSPTRVTRKKLEEYAKENEDEPW